VSAVLRVERQQMSLYCGGDEDSPPMDFDSDEETLLRLPRDTSPPRHGLLQLFRGLADPKLSFLRRCQGS